MEMNETNITVAVLSQATDVERQNKSSSFHLSGGSKYLHKKFKRIASAEIDDNSTTITNTHINENETNNSGDTVNNVRSVGGATVTCKQNEIVFLNEKTKCIVDGSLSDETDLHRPNEHELLTQEGKQLISHSRYIFQ